MFSEFVRGHSGLSLEETAEMRWCGKVQVVAYGLDTVIRTLEQFLCFQECVVFQPFRWMLSSRLLDYKSKVFCRYPYFVCIEFHLSVLLEASLYEVEETVGYASFLLAQVRITCALVQDMSGFINEDLDLFEYYYVTVVVSFFAHQDLEV